MNPFALWPLRLTGKEALQTKHFNVQRIEDDESVRPVNWSHNKPDDVM